MKKEYCQKCKKYGWVENHHILPKSDFGENDQTIKRCPNCHTDYHQKLGRKNLKGKSEEFHFRKFYKWLAGLSIALFLLFIIFQSLN